jgi:outer membrane biosynthesis protein TonB
MQIAPYFFAYTIYGGQTMNKTHSPNRKARSFAALALAFAAILTLTLGLALRPVAAEARSAPGTVVRKDKETETPKPTKTADPSKTPEPTETETVEPTETVELTETPEPTETETVEPTETPEGTKTPEGTETPEGTQTPDSTRTPAPVAERTRFELKGALEVKGAGIWRIAGQDVLVDGSTRIDESDGAAVAGAQVEAKGFRDSAGRLLATRIKVESGGGGGGSATTITKWRGFIEKLPATGLVGEWQVGGRKFAVTNQTQLPDAAAAYKLGVWVKVQALQAGNGLLTAHEVELEND